MDNLFFALNQPNYARYLMKYVSEVLNVKVTDLNLLEEFRRVAFGVKTSNRNFSRCSVDYKVETTINADAANSSTGIWHFTTLVSARQRWALSHSVRATIISKLLENIGISRRDDTMYELGKARMETDRITVMKIVETFKQNVNPFDTQIEKDQHFHVTTGKAASPVTDFLLNLYNNGSAMKLKFLSEGSQDENI